MINRPHSLPWVISVIAWLAIPISVGAIVYGPSSWWPVVTGTAGAWWVTTYDRTTIRRVIESTLRLARASFEKHGEGGDRPYSRHESRVRQILDVVALIFVGIFVVPTVWIVGGWPLTFTSRLDQMPVQIFVILIDIMPLSISSFWLTLRCREQLKKWFGST